VIEGVAKPAVPATTDRAESDSAACHKDLVCEWRRSRRRLAAATGGLMVTNATDLEHLLNVMSN
jgi:hypothetical protein